MTHNGALTLCNDKKDKRNSSRQVHSIKTDMSTKITHSDIN